MQAKDVGPTSPGKVYQYLASLIGTDNAWRSAAEIAKHLESDTLDGRNAVAKALWTLNNNGRISRRMRPGTGFKECMALVDDASVRQAAQRPAPNRVAIAPPVAGPVALRVEAAPAPVLPEPSPEAREAVEKLVRSPTPALTLADVLRKHGRSASVRDPKAVQSGPLSDSNGPISSDTEEQTCSMPPSLPEITPGSAPDAAEGATVAPTFDVQGELAGIAERCAADADDSDPTVELEIARLMELANRGSRRVLVERVPDKVSALVMLAEALRSQFDTSRTAALLDEIVADLERVAAGA